MVSESSWLFLAYILGQYPLIRPVNRNWSLAFKADVYNYNFPMIQWNLHFPSMNGWSDDDLIFFILYNSVLQLALLLYFIVLHMVSTILQMIPKWFSSCFSGLNGWRCLLVIKCVYYAIVYDILRLFYKIHEKSRWLLYIYQKEIWKKGFMWIIVTQRVQTELLGWLWGTRSRWEIHLQWKSIKECAFCT